MATPTRALRMNPHWAEEILSGRKDLELRSSNTQIRGRISLSCGKYLVGEVNIINSFLIAYKGDDGLWVDVVPGQSFEELKVRHRVNDDLSLIKGYKKLWAWELSDPIKYDNPKEFDPPHGAVVWVDLVKARSRIIRSPEQRIRRVKPPRGKSESGGS